MEVQWHSRRRRARLSNGESYRKLKPLYTQYTVWKYKARGEQTLPSSREISENLVPQQVLSLLEREVLSYNTQLLDTYTHHRLSAARSSCRGTFFLRRETSKASFPVKLVPTSRTIDDWSISSESRRSGEGQGERTWYGVSWRAVGDSIRLETGRKGVFHTPRMKKL